MYRLSKRDCSRTENKSTKKAYEKFSLDFSLELNIND